MAAEINTEDNLFNSLGQENDDNEDVIVDHEDNFLSNEIGEFEENEEEELDLEVETPSFLGLLDEEEESEEEEEEIEEEEEEENELTDKDLESFNKKLGTDFKSVDDLKKSFKKEETESEEKKEAVLYDNLKEKVFLYDKYIDMDNESLIRSQLMSEAQAKKLDINDPEVIESVEEKLEGLRDLEQLDSMAETLRANLIAQKDKVETQVTAIDQKREASEKAVMAKNREDLEVALSNIFVNKTFYGADLKKEDVLEFFKNITTGKFHDRVNNNQEMIAQFAMFVKFKDVISKKANGPTQSDNTKREFNLLKQESSKNSRSVANARGTSTSGSPSDNLKAFIK